ncbi:MAG: Flp pilus assembly protein CpaB [Gallionellaceae bacterium]|nr:Flp pilus assembly protein CpaB [Gallionellaceae bacterium]
MLLALALAGYAWMLSSRMAAEQKAAQPKMQPVVVALARIPADSVITPEMVKVSMFPTRPDGAYTDVGAVTGQIASTDIAAGEPILQERLGGGLRAMLQHIEPNERAVAIRVDEVIGVGNKLIPGDLVDVFFTLRRNGSEIVNTQSQLLLERLPVLAFGSKDVGGSGTKPGNASGSQARTTAEVPKTAVLAVKIADIDKLALAAESGRLLLALRPHEQPQSEEAGVAATPASTPAATPAKGQTAQPVATTVMASAPAPLTLKQLITMTGQSPAKTTTGKRPRGSSGDSVIVMHGLTEKTVRVAATRGARP